jgi:hypothetical protein
MYCKTLFVSLDAEFDGTNVIRNSMRSIGAAIFEENNTLPLGTFYVTLKPQANAKPDMCTLNEFWAHHPNQWQEVNTNNLEIVDAMRKFSDFLHGFAQHKLIFVSSAVSADWTWLKIYMDKYGPPDAFNIGFYCHCLSSELRMYMILNGIGNEAEFKQSLSEDKIYDHHALNDAIHQGVLYVNLRMLVNMTKKKKMFVSK